MSKVRNTPWAIIVAIGYVLPLKLIPKMIYQVSIGIVRAIGLGGGLLAVFVVHN